MNISTLAAFGVAGTIALLSVSPPLAEGATATAAASSASGLPVVKLKPKPKPVVRQVRGEPRIDPRETERNLDIVAPKTAGSAPSVMGPSAAASAGGPGFAVIANPVGAAASAAPPRPDAGAPTDPKMR
jgi:hypothetical protein